MSSVLKKRTARLRRKKRVRMKIHGSAERPRLSIFKSARHINAQVVNDDCGLTLASISSYGQGSGKAGKAYHTGTSRCYELGRELGKKCRDKGITAVVFDRGGYPYHGRVQSFAEGAREEGLLF